MMEYKGYTGSVTYDDEAGILFGRVQDIHDVNTFQGESVEEVRQAFRDSIDDYLAFCAEQGKDPDKPYSGKLPFRTTPEHHRLIARAAHLAGMSINAWMDMALADAASAAVRAERRRSAG